MTAHGSIQPQNPFLDGGKFGIGVKIGIATGKM
jgi:gamma-glutamyl phosphate reductase